MHPGVALTRACSLIRQENTCLLHLKYKKCNLKYTHRRAIKRISDVVSLGHTTRAVPQVHQSTPICLAQKKKAMSDTSKSKQSATWGSTYWRLQFDSTEKYVLVTSKSNKSATWDSTYIKLQMDLKEKSCQIDLEERNVQPEVALTSNCNSNHGAKCVRKTQKKIKCNLR